MKSGQTLIFDADDTLWANVIFERVIEDYLDWVVHPNAGPCPGAHGAR